MSNSNPIPEETASWYFERISAALIEGTARSIRHRQQQLILLYNELLKARSELVEALQHDVGLTKGEALFEHSLTLQDIRICYDGIDLASENSKFRRLEREEDNYDHAVPFGIVYILPLLGLYSILSPLVASITAGNCVVLELPQTTSRLNDILRKLLTETLSRDTFTVTTIQTSQAFLERCLVVCQTRTNNLSNKNDIILSPKNRNCVSFVDRGAAIATAARSIFQSRFAFGGRAPYATNIAFVHDAVIDVFKRQLAQLWIEMSFSSRKFDRKQRKQDRHEGFTEIQVGNQGTVVEIEHKSETPKLPDFTTPTLVICSMKSTDEGIDMCMELCGNDALAAAFIFAPPKSANYIAQNLQANLTTVDHIPLEALVGPLAPSGSSPIVLPRYSPSIFQQKRPQLSHVSDLSVKVGGLVLDNTKLMAWTKFLEAPLPDSGEKEGKRVDFFEQAMITAAGASLLVILAASIMGAMGLRRWRS